MHDFTFHAPDSLAGALELLAEHDGDAKLLAGGTSLTTLLKQSLIAPDHVVSLHRVPGLDSIEAWRTASSASAGSPPSATWRRPPVVKQHAPLLAEAYRRVATVRIRNVATVGGGIAQADPAMDPPPSLLILGASVVATSTRGERVIPISEVYADYYETTLEPDEIVTELRVPAQPSGAGWTYIKYLPRTEDDYATVSVAAIGSVEGGSIADVRVALGAVAPTAVRASVVEEALAGQAPTLDALREASQAVADIVDPTDDPRGSAWYKRDMSVVFTRRALEQVLGVS